MPHLTGLAEIRSPSAARMVIDGREVLNFGGSSYLGLSGHPELIEAGAEAVRALGSTSQLPRHYGLALSANLDAEAEAQAFFGQSGAIYFATGYMFGLLVCQGLADAFDVALIDESGHWNLFDGARAAQKRVRTFRHRDAEDLARALAEECADGSRPLVATDGMFATFGTSPPLDAYSAVIAPYDGWLVVDESHSFGSLGEAGRGACELFGVEGPRTIAGGSMGKAFCAHGGLAVGSADTIARLWSSSAAKGSVSGTSMGAAMTAAALRHVRTHPERLARLRRNGQALKAMLRSLGLAPVDNSSSVAAFEHGPAAKMKSIQAALWDAGIFVIYSTYVGAGPEGALRIAAFADHDEGDFVRLGEELSKLL